MSENSKKFFSSSYSPTCILEGDHDFRCDACFVGYEGQYCERYVACSFYMHRTYLQKWWGVVTSLIMQNQTPWVIRQVKALPCDHLVLLWGNRVQREVSGPVCSTLHGAEVMTVPGWLLCVFTHSLVWTLLSVLLSPSASGWVPDSIYVSVLVLAPAPYALLQWLQFLLGALVKHLHPLSLLLRDW